MREKKIQSLINNVISKIMSTSKLKINLHLQVIQQLRIHSLTPIPGSARYIAVSIKCEENRKTQRIFLDFVNRKSRSLDRNVCLFFCSW